MDWDNEFDEMIHGGDRTGSILDEGSGAELDPLDISNPSSAYLFLSDDAQDEISGVSKTRMKCLSCGNQFMGEIYDRCPKCDSLNTEEAISILDDEEDFSGRATMKCLDCRHTFVGGLIIGARSVSVQTLSK